MENLWYARTVEYYIAVKMGELDWGVHKGKIHKNVE